MEYDVNIAPRTPEQRKVCVDHYFAIEQQKAAANPAYQPRTRAQIEQMFACYYQQPATEMPEPELTPEQILAQKRAAIDAETSAAILAGFDYVLNGVTYKIHYDRDDQLNFESGATGCLMKKSGVAGLPDTAPVNAYLPDGGMVRLELGPDEFLALYGAALAHKAACLETGSAKKAALEA